MIRWVCVKHTLWMYQCNALHGRWVIGRGCTMVQPYGRMIVGLSMRPHVEKNIRSKGQKGQKELSSYVVMFL